MTDPVVILSTGDVVGPNNSTDGTMVLFDGTSGKKVKGNNAVVTTQGLALLDDVDAAANRATIGLAAVNNTSDLNKPVSTLQQAAIDLKATKATTLAGYGITETFVQQGGGVGQTASKISIGWATNSRLKATVEVTDLGSIMMDSNIATQPVTDAGVDDTTIVTPKKLRFGFVFLAALTGYIVFPTWLGGFIIQWGTVSTPNTVVTVPYPLTYPTASFATVATARTTSAGLDGVEISTANTSGFSAVIVSAAGVASQVAGTFSWISVGK